MSLNVISDVWQKLAINRDKSRSSIYKKLKEREKQNLKKMKQNRNEIQNIVTNYLLLMWFILKLWTQALKYKTFKQIAHEEKNKTDMIIK